MNAFSRYNPQCKNLRASCKSPNGMEVTMGDMAQATGVFFENDPVLAQADLTTPLMQISNIFTMSPKSDCPTWWNISLSALEVKRLVADIDPAVEGLGQGTVINDGFPNTLLKARITYENVLVPRTVDIDIGTSTRVSIFAPNIDISLLVPTGGGYTERGGQADRQNAKLYGPGLITDTIISGSAVPHCNPLGYRTATCTRTRNEFRDGAGAYNAAPFIERIPSAAKTLTMYQDPANNDDLSWQWIMMDAAETTILGRLGEITPDPITRGFQDIDVVEGATHIVRETALAGVDPYLWSFVWEVEL